MKKLFAAVSYTFDNFYNNLNTRGQIIFSVRVGLILILCTLLFIMYTVQGLKNKARFKRLKKNINEGIKEENLKKQEEVKETEYISEIDSNSADITGDISDNSGDISDIAKRVEDAIKEERPINLTNFEEVQEREAIISIDELMRRAKELEIIEDDNTGINYLEKFNLEPSEIENAKKVINNEPKKEVKAFRVSQVISPVYGIKKEVIENNSNN